MSLDIPIIPNVEIAKLPFRCLAALAFRSLCRVEEVLLLLYGKKLRGESRIAFEKTKEHLAQIMSCSPDVESATEIMPWSMYKDFEILLERHAGGSVQRIAMIAAQESTRLNGRKTNSAIGSAIELSMGIKDEQLQDRLRFLIADSTHHDFESLANYLAAGQIETDSAVENNFLGEVWREIPDWNLLKSNI